MSDTILEIAKAPSAFDPLPTTQKTGDTDMRKLHFILAATAMCIITLGASIASAQDKVVIGHLGDMSGPYADIDGKAGSIAIQMAIDDFGGKLLGKPIELITADHLNKADVGSARVREWADTRGLNLLVSGANSGVALAASVIANEKKFVHINTGAAASALTNEQCSPYVVHYVYDSVAMAKTTAKSVVDLGGKSWYFLTVDYSGGLALERDAAAVVKASGGTVVGSSRHPLNASDFSSFLVQARNSKAQVLALANAGGDMSNAIKAASEFGVNKAMTLVASLAFITDVHGIGLAKAQGMLLTTSWYWDKDEPSRQFAKRFFEKNKRMPTDVQAGNYSATMAYLKAGAAAKSTSADKIMEQLKKLPIDDFYAKGNIRPDGRFVHDMYLAEVKSPAESERPWDYLKIRKTVSGESAFTTKAESKCSLWK